MTKTVTGEYKSKAQITNIQEELIAAGIPREQIFVDKKTRQIKVMIADVTEPEIEGIFLKHKLDSMSVSIH